MNHSLLKITTAVCLGLVSFAASAAPILFVSRLGGDASIATVLSKAGHSVTSVMGSTSNAYQSAKMPANLSSYAAVYWSATFPSADPDLNASIASLTSYVNDGGHVFVTGYDSMFATNMQNFLVGSTSNIGWRDTCGAPGKIANISNSLTTGVTDIRGATPGTTGNQTCDRDSTRLASNTVGIVEEIGGPGYYQWTLRNLGLGQIAYVSNGIHARDSSMWTDNSPYQAALLNFAFNAEATDLPEPGTLGMFGLGFAGLAALRRRRAK